MTPETAPARAPTLTLTIDPPIELQRGRYDTLELREPTAKQMLNAEAHLRRGVNMESVRLREIELVAAVSGWPKPAVELLPISKLVEAADFLLGFSQAGPATGES